MTHEQQLASVRRWFHENNDWIRLTALAKRVNLPQSTLFRALTENVNQQRNVDAELLATILKLLSATSFNPKTNYVK